MTTTFEVAGVAVGRDEKEERGKWRETLLENIYVNLASTEFSLRSLTLRPPK